MDIVIAMLRKLKRKLQGLLGWRETGGEGQPPQPVAEPKQEKPHRRKPETRHEGQHPAGSAARDGQSNVPRERAERKRTHAEESLPRRHTQERSPKTEPPPSAADKRKRPPKTAIEGPPSHLPQKTHAKTMPTAMPTLIEQPAVAGKVRFADFDVSREVLLGVQDLGFQHCTPIQAKTIAELIKGRDVLGKAQTGTGKTAAFLTAAFTRMLRHQRTHMEPGVCRMLVLAPTRELAIQIHKDAEDIGKYCGFNNLVVFGGMGHKEQRNALQEHIDLLVGTPGRIIDYFRSGHLRLGRAEILVIDEADRMLDMGFIPDVRRIVAQLPPTGKRQTMLFSATLTQDITRLSSRWLTDPLFVEIEPDQVVAGSINQQFYIVTREEKFSLLMWILRNEKVDRMLIFVNRKDFTDRLAAALHAEGFACEQMSGDIPQEKRLKILERFRSGATPIIVATDVAARGIHVDDISHVVNYDMPHEPEDYVHRIGRTGRAGKVGQSVSLLCEYGSYLVPELEKLLGQQIKCTLPTEEMVSFKMKPGTARASTDSARPSRYGQSSSRGGGRPPRRDGRPPPRGGSRPRSR